MDRNPDGGRRKDDWHLTGDIPIEHGKGDPFAAAIRATRMAMIITDPRRPDNPIVFANDAFLKLSGYDRDEVIGHNCRFLQGADTDRSTVDAIRDAIAARTDINVDILNYRKDGTTFWNALYISPVFTEDGELQFFFSSQLNITDRKEAEERVRAEKDRFEQAVQERTAELQGALEAQTALLHEVDHRVKNNLQMISSLIVMQSRTIPDETIRASLRTMLERVEAMATVHRRLYQSEDVSRFDLGDFSRDLVGDLVAASGKPIKVDFQLGNVDLPAERAAPVALIVNELVTNAIKHAFPDGRDGRIAISVVQEGDLCRIEVRDDGPGMDGAQPPANSSSFGMKLIRALGKQLGGQVEWRDGAPGTTAALTIPVGTKSGARAS
jgi:PAS domain S-box-containing protein